ncbi:MAG: ABC transporter ATP-binding protein, partial [Sterolibacteriaceae bacterium]|nr:ABC transporter ATP-binding protein [Sterolibacteriaceae bacterium]
MNTPVIRIRELSTRFGEVWIHKGLDLAVERGE